MKALKDKVKKEWEKDDTGHIRKIALENAGLSTVNKNKIKEFVALDFEDLPDSVKRDLSINFYER